MPPYLHSITALHHKSMRSYLSITIYSIYFLLSKGSIIFFSLCDGFLPRGNKITYKLMLSPQTEMNACIMIVVLRPGIHSWLKFHEDEDDGKVIAEVRWRASARVWGLELQPRFEWTVLIQIITWYVRFPAYTYGIVAELSERETVYSASRRHLGFNVPTRGNTPCRDVA